MSDERVLTDFVCTACGLLCDDLTLRTAGDRVVAVAPPCPLAEAFFLAPPPAPAHAAMIAGQAAPLDAALARAAELLAAARAPLVMGLERATCEAQRAVVALADHLGAWLDPTDDRGVSSSHAAAQGAGFVAATLGEVALRSKLAVYWQVDPDATHPRHRQRVARGRVVVVDSRRTATSAAADQFIQIRPDGGAAALAVLRALVRGRALDDAAVRERTGAPLETWRQFAAELSAAQYPAIFHAAPEATPGTSGEVAAVTALVHDLHRTAGRRAVALPLGRAGNAAGAAQVLAWQTGFPAAVSFAAGYPQYEADAGTAAALLARRAVDAAVVIAADPLAHLSATAAEHLRSIPLVVIDDRATATSTAAAVAIHTAPFGLSTPGQAFRSDGVALPLRAAVASPLPQLADVIGALLPVREG